VKPDKEQDDENFDKIKVFSSEDEKLKFLGEILSNESSRKIFLLITTQKMTSNDIAKKLELRLSLVIHHLNKMMQIGIVQINEIGKNTKNHDVKYYVAKKGIIIFPNDVLHRSRTNKMFSKSIKQVFRFTMIAIGGLSTWFISNNYFKSSISLDRPYSTEYAFDFIPLIITLIVIGVGITIERINRHLEIKKESTIR